jgi:hypothetical protein
MRECKGSSRLRKRLSQNFLGANADGAIHAGSRFVDGTLQSGRRRLRFKTRMRRDYRAGLCRDIEKAS